MVVERVLIYRDVLRLGTLKMDEADVALSYFIILYSFHLSKSSLTHLLQDLMSPFHVVFGYCLVAHKLKLLSYIFLINFGVNFRQRIKSLCKETRK